MIKILSERNIVILLFFFACVLFAIAQENTRKILKEQEYFTPVSAPTPDQQNILANTTPVKE